jgi:hypothetical protein
MRTWPIISARTCPRREAGMAPPAKKAFTRTPPSNSVFCHAHAPACQLETATRSQLKTATCTHLPTAQRPIVGVATVHTGRPPTATRHDHVQDDHVQGDAPRGPDGRGAHNQSDAHRQAGRGGQAVGSQSTVGAHLSEDMMTRVFSHSPCCLSDRVAFPKTLSAAEPIPL